MEQTKPKRGRPPIGGEVCWIQFSINCEQKKWLKEKRNASAWLRRIINEEMLKELEEETDA